MASDVQLDKARIAIRERSFIDILDLALRVLYRFARPLAVAWLAGVAPAMIVNSAALYPLREVNAGLDLPLPYMLLMVLLVVWEIPLITAPMTLYLGQATFQERPAARQIAWEFLGSLGQLILYQVLLRVPLLAWPYLNEVILLERNPMIARRRFANSTSRRCVELHMHEGGDVFVRALFSAGVALVLAAALWVSIGMIRSLLLSDLDWDNPVFTFWFQLSLWVVAGYFTVVRFLCYLDRRIRREGWEVELLMRAEGERLSRQLV